MSKSTVPEFSRLRAAFWPIHGYELKKFLPTSLMMFFILLNYTMLRNIKDSLIVTKAGAEVITFLKFWVVVPAAMAFMVLYIKLSNAMERDKIFYTIISVFVVYFILFAFVLYPCRHLIHPDPQVISSLQETYPRLRFIFPIYGFWSYSLFYTFAELWSSVCLGLLFWQFANQITRTYEAKRFYAMFGIIGNLSLIVGGGINILAARLKYAVPSTVDAWGVTLQCVVMASVISASGAMILYWWMTKNVLTDPFYYDEADTLLNPQKQKAKLSLRESFRYIFTSPYLGLIALLVLGYGMSINLVEVTWKSQLRLQYPDENEYSSFMGYFSSTLGVVMLLFVLMTKGIINRFGWFAGAITTPLMILVTGVIFFIFVVFQDLLTVMNGVLTFSPILLAIWVGGIQNILSKATKYSLFDPTKEMAYIPLDEELKVKGKAAVDVVGSRLGKSGGAMVQQILLILIPGSTQLTIAPYLGIIEVLVIFVWILAVYGLNKRFLEISGEKA